MNTLGKFKELGAIIEIKPVSKQIEKMDVHLRARIGRKQFVRSLCVSTAGDFEHDLRATLLHGVDEIIELMKVSDPEIFQESDT